MLKSSLLFTCLVLISTITICLAQPNPFGKYQDKEIFFKNLDYTKPNSNPNYKLLDSSCEIGTSKYAYLSPDTFGSYFGTVYLVNSRDGGITFSFLNSGFYRQPSDINKVLLAGGIYNENDPESRRVYLAQHFVSITNTNWKPEYNVEDDSYSFANAGTGPNINPYSKYLDASVFTGQVYMSPSKALPNFSGTRWRIGVRKYFLSEIKTLVNSIYPNVVVNGFYQFNTNTTYYTLESHIINTIYQSSGLSTRTVKTSAFDVDDFAYALRSAAGNWLYTQEQPILPAASIGLGVMYGNRVVSGTTSRMALNFYVTPFLELKLINPLDLSEIDPTTFTPDFIII
eukprot:gene7818-9623_t